MYEKPNLNCVGNAEDVILGIMNQGNDIDGSWMPGGPNGPEFAFDGDDQQR
jgi:hypothetical protein